MNGRFLFGLAFLVLIQPLGGRSQAPRRDALTDFNGDGFADLAIGAPGENNQAGAVHVLYGASTGLMPAGTQLWSQASTGIPGDPQTGDWFGKALAIGDFDHDGFDDLAIAAPYELAGGGEGVVHVLYGSELGLTASGTQLWSQASAGIPDAPEPGDRFGYSLTAGDFDNDGFADLAIGASAESHLGADGVGTGHVLYGSATGLAAAGTQLWAQGVGGMPGFAHDNDAFGGVLASGDFNGDGFADLAITAVQDRFNEPEDGPANGAVYVLYGSAGGLTVWGAQRWGQGTPGIPDTADPHDDFGGALAAGDFNNDGHDDLAIGVPHEGFAVGAWAGAVHILYGSVGGLTVENTQFWTQNSGLRGEVEPSDQFGESLTSGDFDNDGFDDLAIGAPHEDHAADAEGVVHVLYGSMTGLGTAGSQLWWQGTVGIPLEPEENDQFGDALASGDFDQDGYDDLVVGVPGENIQFVSAGAVHIIYGSASGLAAARTEVWSQNTKGMPGEPELNDRFGWSLANGR